MKESKRRRNPNPGACSESGCRYDWSPLGKNECINYPPLLHSVMSEISRLPVGRSHGYTNTSLAFICTNHRGYEHSFISSCPRLVKRKARERERERERGIRRSATYPPRPIVIDEWFILKTQSINRGQTHSTVPVQYSSMDLRKSNPFSCVHL